MTIEEEIARALSPLLNRVRAEALREASWKYTLECRTPADVRDMIRAEETIEKGRTVLAWAPDHDGSDPLRVQGDYMWRAQLADEALDILTEYDKQKEADHG